MKPLVVYLVLGGMGAAIAKRLQDAGYTLTVLEPQLRKS